MNDVVTIPRRRGRPPMVVVAASSQSTQPSPAIDGRHEVVVEIGKIDKAADDTIAGLMCGNSPYYLRDNALVREIRPQHTAMASRKAVAALVEASAPMLRDDSERVCRYISWRKKPHSDELQAVQVPGPKELPAVILARGGRLPVPQVRGIAEVPLLHADGSMVYDGYDPRSGVVVVAPGAWPPVPDAPSEEDAREALTRLDAVIAGFPFVDVAADRAVTLAAMLSAVLRPTLPACPAFAWSAPVRGSGKSKLADVCAVIATGRTAPAMSWPSDQAEAEKRLGATVMSGDAVILLDNIETALRGDCLNSLLTQPTVSLRVLGHSQMLRIGAAVLVLATGNNLVLLGDLSRRFLVAHLDPETERPELRRFDFDPVVRTQSERGALVAALQTIAKWGASQPGHLPPLGSFEVWSRRVRDPLVALGLPDCTAVLEELHRADPDRETALEVLTEWQRAFKGDGAVTVADAIRKATRQGSPDEQLRNALDAVAGGPGGLNARRLGRYLLRTRDRVFGQYVLRKGPGDLAGKVANWEVETVPASGVSGVSGVSSSGSEISGNKGSTSINAGGLGRNPETPETPEARAYRLAQEGDDDVPF